jgi:hypothetical protein
LRVLDRLPEETDDAASQPLKPLVQQWVREQLKSAMMVPFAEPATRKACELCTDTLDDGCSPGARVCGVCLAGLIRRWGAQKSSKEAIALLIDVEVEKLSQWGVLAAGDATVGATPRDNHPRARALQVTPLGRGRALRRARRPRPRRRRRPRSPRRPSCRCSRRPARTSCRASRRAVASPATPARPPPPCANTEGYAAWLRPCSHRACSPSRSRRAAASPTAPSTTVDASSSSSHAAPPPSAALHSPP